MLEVSELVDSPLGLVFMDLAPPWTLLRGVAGGADPDPLTLRNQYAHFLASKVQREVCSLSTMLERWKQLVNTQSVLNDIARGHMIVFKDGILPPRTGIIATRPESFGPVKALLLDKELASLLAKGSVEFVPADEAWDGYYSHYFLVTKKGGEYRPILNLKPFNKYVEKVRFRMIRTPVLLSVVKQGDWLVSVDLKDAFQHIPIAVCHRKFFRFSYRGQCYQYTRLPFGYRLSPVSFTRCVKAAVSVLMRRGMRLLWYLDDLLLIAGSPEAAMHQTSVLITFLEHLGLVVNYKKSTLWPARQIVYLGIQLDTVSMRATLSVERWDKLITLLAQFAPGKWVTYHTIKRFMGTLSAAHQVIPLGMLFMRRLQLWYASLYSQYGEIRAYNTLLIQVPVRVELDLVHWTQAAADRVGVPMGPREPRVTIFTDASLKGYGAILGYKTLSGLWPPEKAGTHINDLETEAIWLAIQHFAPLLVGSHVCVMTDSMTAKATINRQGSTKYVFRNDLARRIWLWARVNVLSLTAVHLPGKENVAADILSRGGPKADHWNLNPNIVAMLWERFGEAQVDLFARKCNTKCRLWYSLYREENPPLGFDSLRPDPWPRELLYAFPPPKHLHTVVSRLIAEGGRMILVAPFDCASTWFPLMVPLIQGQRFDLPLWEDAMTQCEGLLREGPWLLGCRLSAWMLYAPGS